MTADAVGGVWQYALDLASGLGPHGVETVLAVVGPEPSGEQRRAVEAAGVEMIVTGLPLDWTAPSARDVEEAGWALARIAIETEPDIVHLSSPALAAGALFPAPVVAVAHSCVATWWSANRSGPMPAEFVWRSQLTRRGYLAADAVTAPTAAFAEATRRIYDLTAAPRVVRNGRRPSQLAAAPSDPFVFTAGRLWDDGKNLAMLDRAAARLSAPVLAAGPLEGPNGARIALANVRALGRLDDRAIAERLSARPVFVSTARYEPFGLAVLEAAQAGCPLVLTDIPTLRELWGGAALFVPVDDDAALAQALTRLLADAQARNNLGRAARERSQAYTAEAMCAGMLGVYRSLLPSAAPVEDAAA
ncbi:MAG TPA: glycosyltransferase family 4 protein [Microvirga sp.]|nr:glycosyltransferase family 4 protein [Microvirga sp.]